jgi:hypothetical protein
MDGSESSRRIKFSRGSTAQRSQTTNNHTIQEEPEDGQPSESGAGETVKEEAETAVKVSAKINKSALNPDHLQIAIDSFLSLLSTTSWSSIL